MLAGLAYRLLGWLVPADLFDVDLTDVDEDNFTGSGMWHEWSRELDEPRRDACGMPGPCDRC